MLNLAQNLVGQMDITDGRATTGHCNVDALGGQLSSNGLCFQALFRSAERCFELLAQGIDPLTDQWAFGGRQCTKPPAETRQTTLFADKAALPFGECRQVGNSLKRGQGFLFESCQFIEQCGHVTP